VAGRQHGPDRHAAARLAVSDDDHLEHCHRLAASPQLTRDLDPLDTGRGHQRGRELVRRAPRLMDEAPLARRLVEAQRVEQPLLAGRPEPGQTEQPVLAARVLELAYARDRQLLPQRARPLRAEARDLEQLPHPRRRLPLELDQRLGLTAAGEIGEHRGGALADPRHREDVAARHHRGEVALQSFDRPRGVRERPDAMRIAAMQLGQLGDGAQGPGGGLAVQHDSHPRHGGGLAAGTPAARCVTVPPRTGATPGQ